MANGFNDFLALLGTAGKGLLEAFTFIFKWAFEDNLANWPVLISLLLMVLVFIKQFITHVIHGV